MASSQIEIRSDSTKESEPVVADNVFTASVNGDFEKLRKLVEQDGASLSSPDNEGCYPLHWAAENNHTEIVQYIIEHGGDVNAVCNSKQTALHRAAGNGCISSADILLQNGADVEVEDVYVLTALQYAVANGKTSFLNHIVAKYHADFDARDYEGRSPLHLAASKGFFDIVQSIIEHGGDVNAIDNHKHTALHYAAMEGHISVADVVLQNGAKVEAANVNGLRALHFAAQNGQTSFLNHMVSKYNAYIDVPDNVGLRPLHMAAMEKHHEIVQFIIEHGGDVNAIDNNKKTVLHLVAVVGSISIADMLLLNGAHVEAVDVDGQRAIHFAAGSGQTSFLKHIVVKYNVDFDVTNNEGMTPLHWAVINNQIEIAQYIIEHGGDVNAVNNLQQTPLHLAAAGGSISVADMLLQNGAHVEVVDEDGNRVLHFAAKDGKTSFLKHIVARYNVDFDVTNNEGMTPLHWAASNGRVDTITWLISKNASQERQDIHGRTPLHFAALGGHIDAFMVLREAATEQEMMIKDNEGNTAIQLSPILTSKALYEECKNSSMRYFAKTPSGTDRPMIIAMQGDAYTGKTGLAFALALRLKCPIISLDNILDATEPTDKRDTLISNTFNIIVEIVRTQIILGLSVIVDSPLSQLSHIQKLASVAYAQRTSLVIIECKPKNEYAYELRFEERGSKIYSSRWYKPKTAWPLPKVPRDFPDNDIPFGVSKLVVDTHDHYYTCRILEAAFDVSSCGYGHKTKYVHDWEFIHKDQEERFTCPCPDCKCKKSTEVMYE